eukprot:CAMPEP_0175051128 /NCGR_PEP_ID=MMETSP0052_2-20121109/7625_1 /TAXON_ID=51329 ORGANISM="Polytomella parva, Strain SAG 63-3" /NCGR_SAMPLE_ID=MMETSP0052_2 /ASSEMBLY_ACC=CAM_ASM_000194 /LENGTH=946 /DNA_ID=CAMNT_0016315373 /DNA_START=5 /DNA_END=2841 /DNA_ORIENTATION=-
MPLITKPLNPFAVEKYSAKKKATVEGLESLSIREGVFSTNSSTQNGDAASLESIATTTEDAIRFKNKTNLQLAGLHLSRVPIPDFSDPLSRRPNGTYCLAHLRILDLSQNPQLGPDLSQLPSGFFPPNLEELHIVGCAVTALPLDVATLPRLRKLCAGVNMIVDPTLAFLSTSLNHVGLSYNRINDQSLLSYEDLLQKYYTSINGENSFKNNSSRVLHHSCSNVSGFNYSSGRSSYAASFNNNNLKLEASGLSSTMSSTLSTTNQFQSGNQADLQPPPPAWNLISLDLSHNDITNVTSVSKLVFSKTLCPLSHMELALRLGDEERLDQATSATASAAADISKGDKGSGKLSHSSNNSNNNNRMGHHSNKPAVNNTLSKALTPPLQAKEKTQLPNALQSSVQDYLSWYLSMLSLLPAFFANEVAMTHATNNPYDKTLVQQASSASSSHLPMAARPDSSMADQKDPGSGSGFNPASLTGGLAAQSSQLSSLMNFTAGKSSLRQPVSGAQNRVRGSGVVNENKGNDNYNNNNGIIPNQVNRAESSCSNPQMTGTMSAGGGGGSVRGGSDSFGNSNQMSISNEPMKLIRRFPKLTVLTISGNSFCLATGYVDRVKTLLSAPVVHRRRNAGGNGGGGNGSTNVFLEAENAGIKFLDGKELERFRLSTPAAAAGGPLNRPSTVIGSNAIPDSTSSGPDPRSGSEHDTEGRTDNNEDPTFSPSSPHEPQPSVQEPTSSPLADAQLILNLGPLKIRENPFQEIESRWKAQIAEAEASGGATLPELDVPLAPMQPVSYFYEFQDLSGRTFKAEPLVVEPPTPPDVAVVFDGKPKAGGGAAAAAAAKKAESKGKMDSAKGRTGSTAAGGGAGNDGGVSDADKDAAAAAAAAAVPQQGELVYGTPVHSSWTRERDWFRNGFKIRLFKVVTTAIARPLPAMTPEEEQAAAAAAAAAAA